MPPCVHISLVSADKAETSLQLFQVSRVSLISEYATDNLNSYRGPKWSTGHMHYVVTGVINSRLAFVRIVFTVVDSVVNELPWDADSSILTRKLCIFIALTLDVSSIHCETVAHNTHNS